MTRQPITNEPGRRAARSGVARSGVARGGIRGRMWARRSIADALLARLEAGAQLPATLRELSETAPPYRAALLTAASRLDAGDPPSVVLAPLRTVLPPELPALVAADGASVPPAAVAALRRGVQLRRALLDRTLARLSYPLVVAVATTVVLVPRAFAIHRIFEEADGGASARTGGFAALALAGLAVALTMLVRAHRRSPAAFRLLSAVPVLGATLRRAAGAAFADALSVLLAAGRPLDAALREAAASSGYRVLADPMAAAAEAIARGHDLIDVLRDDRLLPAELVWMVGREAGPPLPERLAEAARVLDQDARRSTDTLVQALFPAIIIALAIVVGIVVAEAYGMLFDTLSIWERIG